MIIDYYTLSSRKQLRIFWVEEKRRGKLRYGLGWRNEGFFGWTRKSYYNRLTD